MKLQASLMTVLLILLVNAEICYGVWCFICHTNDTPECGDDFRISTGDPDKRQQCQGSCVKRRGKRRDGAVSRTEIHRSCRLYGAEGCYDETSNGITQYTCLCNSNFCNSASDVSYSFAVVSAGATITVLLNLIHKCF